MLICIVIYPRKYVGTQNQDFVEVSKTVQAFQFGVQTDASTL